MPFTMHGSQLLSAAHLWMAVISNDNVAWLYLGVKLDKHISFKKLGTENRNIIPQAFIVDFVTASSTACHLLYGVVTFHIVHPYHGT
jgi:hypothetical protein